MILALSTGLTILALAGLAAGALVLVVVVMLFQRTLWPAQEIDRYARDILDAGVGIATNLDGVERLTTTRRLATAVPGLATAYLRQLGLGR